MSGLSTLPQPRRNVVGWSLLLAALVLYALLWQGTRQGWGWLDGADSAALHATHAVGVEHPGWVRFWDGLSTAFAPTVFRLLGVAAAAFMLVRHRLRAALFVLVSVELTGFLTQAAKGLADRPRPVTALAAASSSSFPSGHALAAMATVTALLTVALPVLGTSMRVAAIVVGVLIVVAVGFARVALNVHHPSDVLAGWALGYLYVSVCARLVDPG